jgi:hypothetical protein
MPIILEARIIFEARADRVTRIPFIKNQNNEAKSLRFFDAAPARSLRES